MDKSWIDSCDSKSVEYINGVNSFLEFAFRDKLPNSQIVCPCNVCQNRFFKSRGEVSEHCFFNGFLKGYKNWTYHGESYVCLPRRRDTADSMNENAGDDMVTMLHEAMRIPNVQGNTDNESRSPCENTGQNADEATNRFFELLKDAESELYPGCVKFTKLSFVVRFLLLKVTNGWTDTSIDMLLELLKEVFPDAKIPTSYYDAQKISDDLGFTSETIDACPNNCMLFRGQDKGLTSCEICGASRYKEEGKKVAAKQMRYFPLKPRLQKLFISSKKASEMKWHKEGRVDDGVFRHPADSFAWKQFDVKWPDFASDSRNVRLGLAYDGFNPFRTMSIAHSTWPVVLIVYNLPPWMCMTPSSFILSILIDRPKGPGTKIDVYLQLLIEDLKELWSTGVPTYDVSADQMFQLRVALLWTINDFPAYAMLSGWSTKGEKACPCCAI